MEITKVSTTEFRKNLSYYMQLSHSGNAIVVVYNGKLPAGVLLGYSNFRELLPEIDLGKSSKKSVLEKEKANAINNVDEN